MCNCVHLLSSLCVCVCEKYQGEDTLRDLEDRSRSHLDIVNVEDYI